jgi:mannose-1-phosphate guanylyltransferase
MTNLILCGGAGTRLWPLSRNSRPKQFYPLFGGKSIFQETIERNRVVADRFWVAANQVQIELARDQLISCGNPPARFLIEPAGRNTAPAIALACLAMPADEIVFVTPSDHRMNRQDDYWRAVGRAKVLAEQGFLVTFGIQPTFPETGFGYIEADGETVKSFREKPDAATAQAYIDSGRYLWNSGMFVFQAGTYLAELAQHCPEVLEACQRALKDGDTPQEIVPTLADMNSIPSISIDYAVMEKSSQVRVVACDPGWSDLGSFDALYDEVSKGPGTNAVLGSLAPTFIDARNNLVVGSHRKIALVDVEDLIVVDTPDALLIIKRGSGQKVKDVVMELKKQGSGLLE